MANSKKDHPKDKPGLHPRNRHKQRYDFALLSEVCPDLARFVKPNFYGDDSVDFFNPAAVKMLNKALLQHFYGIVNWDIPSGYLCPPIPGRADYIHHIADLLASRNLGGKPPTGSKITCLDIGVGANCVYPIIGNKEYGWRFIGSDIDPVAIANAEKIVAANPPLQGQIECRLQPNVKHIFRGIIKKDERVDVTICNPPFHASLADAQTGTQRKLKNLTQKKSSKPVLNFGGQNNELWCDGGEENFVAGMVAESRGFAASCFWFSTLISKESNLKSVYYALKKAEAAEVKTLAMSQGNKTSRIVAWTFLNKDQQKNWVAERW